MDARNEMELPEAEIRLHYPQALSLLTGFEHAPRLIPAARAGGWAADTARLEGVRLLERIEGASDDDLLTPAAATMARVLRRATAIALAVAGQVGQRSGGDDLQRIHDERGLPTDRVDEFSAMLAVEALAALSVLANATMFLLVDHASGAAIEGVSCDEVLTDNPLVAIQGALWELDRNLAHHVRDDASMIATALAWAEALSAAVALRAESVPGISVFTRAGWRVAEDDFPIAGFAPPTRIRRRPMAMSFATPEEVVGNAIAKHQTMRLARMMVAYDFDQMANPFVELGGFIFTFLGDGRPGTGKTTLIRMMAGLLTEYCGVAGYRFRYRNLSVDNIDSYQGKSGQNARSFVNAILDPTVIGFGSIDDIDQIAARRGDRQSSSGQQEITAVLMEAFAGATHVVRGNCSFGMFSNHAELIDDALRQRAGARFLIDGPQSRADYIDILGLFLGSHHDIPVGAHDLMRAQIMREAVADSYAGHARPAEPGLARILDGIRDDIGEIESLADLGGYLHAIAQTEPRFTGRAVKNIADAVKARAMDIDMPDEWFATPEPFLHQPYARKLAMISELRKPITTQMVLQEINRYADSEWRYADSADEAAVVEALRGMERMAEAKRRFEGGQ